jgi:solute carrier family 40 (iron-regulated transporter), member 1
MAVPSAPCLSCIDCLLPRSVSFRLYTSHALSRWGDRMWDFSITMILAAIGSGSALLPAVYGTIEGLCVFFLSPVVGASLHVEGGERLTIIRRMLLTQNLSVALSAFSGVCALLAQAGVLSNPAVENSDLGLTEIWLIAFLMLFGCVASVSGVGSNIAVEKDWVVVVCENDEARLSQMNAVMRRIDLFCKTAAPVLTGLVMEAGIVWGAGVVAVWNLISLAFEYRLLELVAAGVAEIGGGSAATPATATATSLAPPSCLRAASKPLRGLSQGWGMYHRLPFWGSAFGLAMLYLSQLNFGRVTSSFLIWSSVPPWAIGLAQGVGAVIGLASTWVYPPLRRRIGLRNTATCSIWGMVLLLIPSLVVIPFTLSQEIAAVSAASVQVETRPPIWALTIFCVALAGTRSTLWIYDLAVSQMLQSWVTVDQRTTLNGVQKALNSLLGVGGMVAAIIVSNPASFGWLEMVSMAVVIAAALQHSCCSRAVVLAPPPAATPGPLESRSVVAMSSSGGKEPVALLSDSEEASDPKDVTLALVPAASPDAKQIAPAATTQLVSTTDSTPLRDTESSPPMSSDASSTAGVGAE